MLHIYFYDRFSFTSNEMDQSSLIMVSQAGLGSLTISFGEVSTIKISTTQKVK